MLYVGKMKFRIWVPSQRSPNMWRETDLNPNLTPKLCVPWHVCCSVLWHVVHVMPVVSQHIPLCDVMKTLWIPWGQAYYTHLWDPSARKSAVHIICALGSVWWMNFEVLTVNQIWGIFMVLSIKIGKWWLTSISPSSKCTDCLTSHQENAKLTS